MGPLVEKERYALKHEFSNIGSQNLVLDLANRVILLFDKGTETIRSQGSIEPAATR